MARLPQVGGDSGNWGEILNSYLRQAHKADGKLEDNSVTANTIAPGAVTKTTVGLGNVNDTADAAKPVSTATQTALDAKADDAALAAKLNTADLDAQTATKIATGGTATQTALSATIAAEAEPGGSLWTALSTETNARARGILTTNTGAQNSAALAAIGLVTGDTLVLPDIGEYEFSSFLPNTDGVTYQGRGVGTRLYFPSSPMLAPTGTLRDVTFADIKLITAGNHLIDLGTTGYLAFAVFRSCYLTQLSGSKSIVSGTGACGFQENLFERCHLTRVATSTTPAFSIVTSNNCDGNTWEKITATSGSTSSGYFWHLEHAASYAYSNTFRHIVGEQNPGGLVHLLSPFGPYLENVIDADLGATAYTASLIKFGKSASGGSPRVIKVSLAGNRGGVMAAPYYHVEMTSSGGGPMILENISDSNNVTRVLDGSLTGFAMIDSSGATGKIRSLATSGSFAADRDGTMVFNGSSVTGTLPDPTTVQPGRTFAAKNVHSTALTIVSAGTSKTIDGAASKSLAQWECGRYRSDGTQWLTV